MQAEIVSIGTELTLGQIMDTNAVYLSRQLYQLGIEVNYRSTVDDNLARIIEIVRIALTRNDIVILCGGLGPTEDDLTRDVIAQIAGVPLEFRPELFEMITNYFTRIRPGVKMPETNRVQAYVPKGAKYFINSRGTAPGILLETQGKLIIALPGPPRELQPMWMEQVRPELELRYRSQQIMKFRILKVVGLSESAINEKIQDLMQTTGESHVGLMAEQGEIAIRILAKSELESNVDEQLERIEREIRSRIGEYIYGTDHATLESVVGDLLRQNQLRLATAESCTGGLLGHRITNVPGSSDYFEVGFVVYSNIAKQKLLGVPAETIETYGAVSEQTALAMVIGLLDRTNVDIGIAITGIAGPTGGTAVKPVGLVYIALGERNRNPQCNRYTFTGERELIKWRSTQEALDVLRKYLIQEKGYDRKPSRKS
ncbi:MAG: competence/damage-inducible protein A [bacterium]|nr:competence/damage-inducible protein A [bacterium]